MLRAALVSSLSLLLCGACSAPTTSATIDPTPRDAAASTAAKPLVPKPVDAGPSSPAPDSPEPIETEVPCRADADCTISCLLPNRCCGLLCQCSRAYHVDVVAKMRAWQQANCSGAVCKKADCPVPSKRIRAICRRGRCVPQ